MLVAASSQLVSAASSTCGYSRDCPRSYSLAAINASASLWDPTNATLQAAFEAERARALTRCSAVHGLGKGHELGGNSHGGWCLRSHNGINTTAFHKNCKGLTCRTFFLPKGPPQYYPADRSFASAIEALLRRGASGAAAEDSDTSAGRRAHDSLADFGAGVGAYGHALLTLDPTIRYAGYDGAGNVEHVTSEFVRWFDLSLPLSLPKADWVLSLEVGEHLPAALEPAYIRNLVAHARKGLITSWANLGQPGYGHINNHSPEYLVSLFGELGFQHEPEATRKLRAAAAVKGNAQYWLAGTVNVFVRS